jgi:hypothetical protein
VQQDDCCAGAVVTGWSHYVGGLPVALARNVDAARRLLLQALDVATGEPVLLPANATHSLVEAIKHSGAKALFGAPDANLGLHQTRPVRISWQQPVLGLPGSENATSEISVLEHGDSLPADFSGSNHSRLPADVVIFGLHLATQTEREGALLVFRNQALFARVMAAGSELEPSLYSLAARQLARVSRLARRQQAAITMVATGLQAAAGLPVLAAANNVAIAHGVAVRIPDEGSPSTFWVYASRENTPVQWLPNLRPVHYAAIASHPQVGAQLERWLLVLVSPGNNEDENRQAVLGIVKPAEYLGLRWRTDPARAAEYAALLDALYGVDHDAYRPAFAIDATSGSETRIDGADVVGPNCRIEPPFLSRNDG